MSLHTSKINIEIILELAFTVLCCRPWFLIFAPQLKWKTRRGRPQPRILRGCAEEATAVSFSHYLFPTADYYYVLHSVTLNTHPVKQKHKWSLLTYLFTQQLYFSDTNAMKKALNLFLRHDVYVHIRYTVILRLSNCYYLWNKFGYTLLFLKEILNFAHYSVTNLALLKLHGSPIIS